MTSQLASQLKRVADNAPHVKSQPTLVLTYKQARDADRSSIFAIGQNGLQELIQLDESFQPFENNLFSESYIDGDITLMSPEDKQLVDKSIKLFLIKLSPYFLHHAAFRCLEWLVRRFRVHEYNVDDIIQCVLPFHETPQFVHVVRILIFTPKIKIGFVEASKKSKIPLERTTVVQRCLIDLSFLKTVCRMFQDTMTTKLFNKYICSFFLCTVTQLLTMKQKPDEDTVRTIFACLMSSAVHHGDHSTLPKDFKTTIVMLLGLLSNWMVMNKEIFSNVQQALQTLLENANVSVITLCLLQMYQSQPELGELNEDFIEDLISCPDFVSKITSFTKSYESSKFMECFAKTLAQSTCSKKSFIALLDQMVMTDALNESIIKKVALILLENKNKNSVALMRTIFSRYGSAVNDAIQSKLVQIKQNSSKQTESGLFDFMSSSFKGSVYQPLSSKMEHTLFSALIHHDESIRLLGVAKISKIASSIREKSEVDEELASLVIQCFEDPSDQIVTKILEIENLDIIVDRSKLFDLVLQIIEAPSKSNIKMNQFAFRHLFKIHSNLDEQEFTSSMEKRMKAAVFGSLAVTPKTLPVFKSTVELMASSKMFNAIGKSLLSFVEKNHSSVDAKIFIDTAIENVIRNAKDCIDAILIMLNRNIVKNKHSRLFALAVLLNIKKWDLNQLADALKVCKNAIHVCEKGQYTSFDGNSVSSGICVDNLESSPSIEWSLLIHVTGDLLEKSATKYKKPIRSLESQREWFNLLSKVNHFTGVGPVLANFMRDHIGSESLIEFLSSYLFESSDIVATRNAICIIECLIKSHCKSQSKKDFQILVPVLLTFLNHSSKPLRESACACLAQIEKACQVVSGSENSSVTKPYVKQSVPLMSCKMMSEVLQDILAKTLEFINDGNQIIFFLSDYLMEGATESINENGKKCKKIATVSKQQELLNILVGHVASSIQLPKIQIQILALMKNCEHALKLSSLLSLFSDVCVNQDDISFELQKSLADLMTPNVIKNCSEAIKKKLVVVLADIFTKASTKLQSYVVSKISPEFFENLSSSKRQAECFGLLLQVCLGSDATEIGPLTRDVIKALPGTDSYFSSAIKKIMGTSEDNLDSNNGKKQRKMDSSEIVPEQESISKEGSKSDRLTLLFELISAKTSQFTEYNMLVEDMFTFITQIYLGQQNEGDIGSREYMMQLVLNILTDLMKKYKLESERGHDLDVVKEEIMKLDTIVSSIRVTRNAQTRNAMLLFLALVAEIYPNLVLINILPIFTFMGASVLRQDDSFTFYVIQQTVETIIPALIKSNEKDVSVIHSVIKMFVDAVTHVPKHRRLKLFTLLVSTLGEKSYMPAVVLQLLIKSIILKSTSLKLAVGKNSDNASVDHGFMLFIKAICQNFTKTCQLDTVLAILNKLVDMPDNIEEVENDSSFDDMDLSSFISDEQVLQFKVDAVTFLVMLSQSLVAKEEDPSAQNTSNNNSRFIPKKRVILNITENVLKMIEMSKKSNSIALLNVLEELMKATADLMEPQAFAELNLRLISGEDKSIRLSSLQLLHDKLSSMPFNAENAPVFYAVVDELTKLIQSDNENGNPKQMAYLILTLMVQQFAAEDQEKYIHLMPLTCEIGSKGFWSAPLLALVSTLTSTLGPRVLSYVPVAVPQVLKGAQQLLNENKLEQNASLLMAYVATLSVFVNELPLFMGPYLSDFISIVVHPQFTNSKISKRQYLVKLGETVNVLAQVIAEKIQTRAVFPKIVVVYEQMIKASASTVSISSGSLGSLFALVSDIVVKMSKPDLTKEFKMINSFFVSCFDFSSSKLSRGLQKVEILSVENSIISAYVQMCVKFNENMFKPCFLKIVDWMKAGSHVSEEVSRRRMTFFYRLSDQFLQKLKTIFAPFTAYFVDDLISLLNQSIESKNPVSTDLWELMMSVTHKIFLYDHDGIVNQEKCMKIMKPLVTQVCLVKQLGTAYMNAISIHAIPAIVQLAVSVREENIWKAINHEVCLQTRHASAQVRMASLIIIRELFTKIGEEFLVFLPETIPFLAELMEDEDGEVEKLCHQTCNDIEQILGEDIQQYFS